MSLAGLIRTELLVALIAVCWAAARQGTNLFDPWLAEAIIIAALWVGCAYTIFIARAIVGGMIGWMLSWGCIWLAVIIVGALLSFRLTIFPQGTFYTASDPAAVEVHTEPRGDREVWATVTNWTIDWLRNAVVSCQIYYDNGTPIGRTYRYGIANGYLGIGESASKRVISWQELRNRRADPALTQCQLKYAQFMERPALPVDVAIGYDRSHWRHVFTVTNHSSQTITNPLLQCRDENGINRTMRTVGRWADDPRDAPVLEPGTSAELVTRDRSFLRLGACSVLSLTTTN